MSEMARTLPGFVSILRSLGLCRGYVRRWVSRYLVQTYGEETFSTQFFGQPIEVCLDNTTDRQVLLSSVSYNRKEIEFLAAHLSDTGLFVDIGANTGLISVGVLASRPDANVIAIEPNPVMAKRARRNLLELSDNFTGKRVIVENAVSNTEEAGYLDLGSGSGTAALRGERSETTITVECRPLRQIIEEQGADRVDVLKIDTDGHEDVVLLDMLSNFPDSALPKAMVIEPPKVGDLASLKALEGAGYRVIHKTRGNLLFIRERVHDG